MRRTSLVLTLVALLVISLAGTTMAAKKGGTLIFGRGGDSVGLDPANVTDGESFKVTRQIYDTLVQFKRENTEVIPGLAHSWDVSEDGKVWTFYLREGIKFHDGTPFNAEAVKFNFERWMYEDHPYHIGGDFAYWGYMFGGYPGIVDHVEAVDEYTFRVYLKEPLGPFLNNLAMPCFGIASPTAIKKYGEDFFKNPVGTSAFIFEEWVRDDKIVLRANHDYWGEGPYLDKLIFRSIPDNSARFIELQAGTIDIADGLNPDDVEFIKRDPNLKLYLRPSMNVGYLAMNQMKEPFDNVLVRRAINHAINKEAIVEAFYAGLAQPAKNPLPPSVWGYNDNIEPYEYNPAKAKELLKEAGYPNGFTADLWAMPVPRPYMPDGRKIAEAIQADLAVIGIKTNIVSFDWGTYLQKTEAGEHDMALLGWTGDNGDPDNFLYVLLDKDNAKVGSAGNIAFYKSDELHELLIKAQQSSDKEERTKLYMKAQEIIHQDAPWVPIAHSTPPIGAKAYIKDYIPHPTSAEKLNQVWLDK
ncbi:MAG: ABC transporter substrate-binding protein [Firmicutes bacterium]|nr:ABC transporter substrate-binding protein [Bacillota bacterium]